jgi:hypothetical protein
MAERRITQLKRRLSVFLRRSDQGPDVNAMLARAIGDVLKRPAARGWKTYLVGGVLRDLLLAPIKTLPRDIDFIVDGPSQAELDRVFEDLVERRTRFGGLHLVKSVELPLTTYAVHFDTWCLQDTWGLKAQGTDPNIDNFLRTPFLDIDCIAARLNGGQSPDLYANGFFEAIDSRTVEINFAPNPFPQVCLVRALILSVQLQFGIGRQLASFACEHAARSSLDDLMDAQVSHYGMVRIPRQELHQWLRTIEIKLHAGAERIMLTTAQARQATLWDEWPPVMREQFMTQHTEP